MTNLWEQPRPRRQRVYRLPASQRVEPVYMPSIRQGQAAQPAPVVAQPARRRFRRRRFY